MTRILSAFAVIASLAVSACSVGDTPEERAAYVERVNKTRETLDALIVAYNAAGVDPLQLPPEKLVYFSLLCTTATVLAPIWSDDPSIVELSASAVGWCDTVTKALGKANELSAAPMRSPIPLARPA